MPVMLSIAKFKPDKPKYSKQQAKRACWYYQPYYDISNYITHIGKKRDTCCTTKHFYETPGHSIEDFSITGIALLENPPTNPEELKLRLWEFEGYWQIKLNTLAPHGLNSVNEYENAQGMITTKKIGKRSYSVWGQPAHIIKHLHSFPLLPWFPYQPWQLHVPISAYFPLIYFRHTTIHGGRRKWI